MCAAPEKALSKWDVVYEIVAVMCNAAGELIDFFFSTDSYTHDGNV